jgi:hypothetical protein
MSQKSEVGTEMQTESPRKDAFVKARLERLEGGGIRAWVEDKGVPVMNSADVLPKADSGWVRVARDGNGTPWRATAVGTCMPLKTFGDMAEALELALSRLGVDMSNRETVMAHARAWRHVLGATTEDADLVAALTWSKHDQLNRDRSGATDGK